MPLQEIHLDLAPCEVPAAVAGLIAEAGKRTGDFYDAGLGRRFPRYVPSDPLVFHRALVGLEDSGLLRGKVFCEWGCGFGIATAIASLLGFESYGIEIEPELADFATRLAGDLGIPLEILNLSYFPDGFEESEGLGGKDLITPARTATRGTVLATPTYDGLDPDEVDLFYVYPWPGQEELMFELFTALSSPGAILLMYLGEGEIAAHLHEDEEED